MPNKQTGDIVGPWLQICTLLYLHTVWSGSSCAHVTSSTGDLHHRVHVIRKFEAVSEEDKEESQDDE